MYIEFMHRPNLRIINKIYKLNQRYFNYPPPSNSLRRFCSMIGSAKYYEIIFKVILFDFIIILASSNASVKYKEKKSLKMHFVHNHEKLIYLYLRDLQNNKI